MRNVLGAMAILLLVSACSTQRIRLTDEYNATTPNYVDSQAFFVGGIGQTKEINAAQICKGKTVDKVETQLTFVDGLLGAITWGIYTPRTVTVYCK